MTSQNCCNLLINKDFFWPKLVESLKNITKKDV